MDGLCFLIFVLGFHDLLFYMFCLTICIVFIMYVSFHFRVCKSLSILHVLNY